MPQTQHPDYSDTARALASHIDDDESIRRQSSRSPAWTRRSIDSAGRSSRKAPATTWLGQIEQTSNQLIKLWFHFTPLQRAGIVLLNIVLLIVGVLFLLYHQSILHAITPVVKSWRNLKAGWLILWSLTFFVSFPPLIGYSTCVTLAGLVYGMKGWFIAMSATIIGSFCSFLVSRTVLRGFVSRLTSKDKRFAALSLVLKHDGLQLLVMIRLCPLPYSISNGAISTIPTVKPLSFLLATAITTPKLLLHVFVGSQLGQIAENGDKMDTRTKVVSYLSIVIGLVAGFATGYFIYIRTKARALEIEAEEAAAAGLERQRSSEAGDEYIDEFDEDGAAASATLRRGDEISLHDTYEDDLEDRFAYRDVSPNPRVNNAQGKNVFDIGDDTDDEGLKKKPSPRRT